MEFLEQHFNTTFVAPNGIKRLRELILTLAMQGKLVPQDPGDPPASQLLLEIEADKTRLVKEGKVKSLKSLPEVKPEHMPYKLPLGWQWVRLGTIGNIFNGNSINSDEKAAKYAGALGLPYIATKDVGYGLDPLDYENGICIPEGEERFRVARRGAVLICAEGGSAGKKCGSTDRDICFGNKLFANELYGGISSRFILYLYLTPLFKFHFEGLMTGIIGGISIAKFIEMLVPLPPLNEQRRIVNKVNQLMVRCDRLEELSVEREQKRFSVHAAAIRQLLGANAGNTSVNAWKFIIEHFGDLYTDKENVADLRRVILQLAVMGKLSEQFKTDGTVDDLMSEVRKERHHLKVRKTTDPIQEDAPLGYEIPASWRWQCLDDLLVYGPTNGFSPKAVSYETAVRSLTLSATTSGTFKGEHSKFIDADIPLDSELWLRDGDILVQRGNALEYVGVPAIYRGESGRFIYPDLIMKLRISSKLDTDFIYFAMSSKQSRDFLRVRASGTSGTMPKINQSVLRSLPIPIPPLREQQRIVSKINRLMALADTLEQHIVAATDKQNELLNAVMAQA